MLTDFAHNIWFADGPTVTAAAGFHYPTRMVVIRLTNCALLLWSPTVLTDELRSEIETLGVVMHLVAPNSLHHTYLRDWQRAYPEAKVYAPPGLREKRPDIRFDADLTDSAIKEWRDEVEHAVMWGNRITTEVVFFHRQSGTAIFTDLIQQFPLGWFKGWRSWVAQLDLMTAAEPAVPRKFRMAFTDRELARQSLQRVLAWPAHKVIIAHGPPITNDGQALIHRAFRWLAK